MKDILRTCLSKVSSAWLVQSGYVSRAEVREQLCKLGSPYKRTQRNARTRGHGMLLVLESFLVTPIMSRCMPLPE
eukprot:scaffold66365_cov13-Tisochrysis_lutea.AAC.1